MLGLYQDELHEVCGLESNMEATIILAIVDIRVPFTVIV